jgi:four helix bundle protein
MGRDYRKLRVFHTAYNLVLKVYRLTEDFPESETRNMTDQIRRSATSIPLNIVEGGSSHSKKVYYNHLNYSYGSARELCILIELAKDLKYLELNKFLPIYDEIEKLKASLYKLMIKLKKEINLKEKKFKPNYSTLSKVSHFAES